MAKVPKGMGKRMPSACEGGHQAGSAAWCLGQPRQGACFIKCQTCNLCAVPSMATGLLSDQNRKGDCGLYHDGAGDFRYGRRQG